ncbi:MAG: FHA domain-containing protein [Pseudomonadota bacterium]
MLSAAQAVRGSLYVTTEEGERIVRLTDGALTVGRGVDCDVVLNDPAVSRRHFRLEVSDSQVQVTDLGSSRGIVVDGVAVSQGTLGHDSTILFGDSRARLELEGRRPEPDAGDEYIEIVAGAEEPTIVETLLPGEVTVSHDGLQQAFVDHSLPRLAIFENGASREYPLTGARTIIGRDEAADITINDPAASRRHAELELRGDRVVLRDLQSKNGTWLRAQPVTEQTLFNGVNFRIGDTFLVFKAGFENAATTLAGDTASSDSKRPPVVVLPGIMGSELHDAQGLFWPNLSKAFRAPEKLMVGSGESLTVGAIARSIIMITGFIKLDAYSELVGYLEEGLGYQSGVDLLEFPYDWRQDNRDSAEKLKLAIDQWRRDVIGEDTKVTILCHSMGALVSRYYLECLGGASKVEKLVTLGGAHFGAPFVIRGLLYGPELLPLGIGRKGLHSALLTMPSAYQLVPPYPCAYDASGKVIDLHEENDWARAEHRHLLRSARDFHREIGTTTSVPTVCIFGYGVKTVTRIQVDERGPEGWEKVRFIFEHAGDNRVAEKYGFLEGADIHPVKQHHGSLWNDNDVKMRIRMELLNER